MVSKNQEIGGVSSMFRCFQHSTRSRRAMEMVFGCIRNAGARTLSRYSLPTLCDSGRAVVQSFRTIHAVPVSRPACNPMAQAVHAVTHQDLTPALHRHSRDRANGFSDSACTGVTS